MDLNGLIASNYTSRGSILCERANRGQTPNSVSSGPLDWNHKVFKVSGTAPPPPPLKAPHSLTGLTFAIFGIFDINGHLTGVGHPNWVKISILSFSFNITFDLDGIVLLGCVTIGDFPQAFQRLYK